MITLKKSFTFEAAHLLPFHNGKCRNLHGHSWKLTVIIKGQKTDLIKGILTDYGQIGELVKPIIEQYLDHQYLNQSLVMESPTSENIAIWCWEHIYKLIPNLYAIRIKETCTSECTYYGNKLESN